MNPDFVKINFFLFLFYPPHRVCHSVLRDPFTLNNVVLVIFFFTKLDGVGPVDNRPSTDNLHQFVKKNKKIEKK